MGRPEEGRRYAPGPLSARGFRLRRQQRSMDKRDSGSGRLQHSQHGVLRGACNTKSLGCQPPTVSMDDGKGMGISAENQGRNVESMKNVGEMPMNSAQAGNGSEQELGGVNDSKWEHEDVTWIGSEREGFGASLHLHPV